MVKKVDQVERFQRGREDEHLLSQGGGQGEVLAERGRVSFDAWRLNDKVFRMAKVEGSYRLRVASESG